MTKIKIKNANSKVKPIAQLLIKDKHENPLYPSLEGVSFDFSLKSIRDVDKLLPQNLKTHQ